MPGRGYWRKESSTFQRPFKSEHVGDLRLIARLALVLMICVFLLFGFFLAYSEGCKGGGFVCQLLGLGDPKVSFSIMGVAGAILAWVYRTAAVRLGVVDLFACEITTLCKVGTVVDIARRSADAFNYAEDIRQGKTAVAADFRPHPFNSQEEYFPVFSSNSRDLELLEADVITDVTAFYTYMKVMRDSLRQIGALAPDWSRDEDIVEWKTKWKELIYMEFLAYEAARHAVRHLIEYEPDEVENTIAILMTELVAYDFLRTSLPIDDFRSGRLALRMPSYVRTVNRLQERFEAYLLKPRRDQVDAWDRAFEVWHELRLRLVQCNRSELRQLGSGTREYSRKSTAIFADAMA